MATDRADSPLRWSREVEAWMDFWASKGRDLPLLTSDIHAILPSQVDTPAEDKIWNTDHNTILDAQDELSDLVGKFHLVASVLTTTDPSTTMLFGAGVARQSNVRSQGAPWNSR